MSKTLISELYKTIYSTLETYIPDFDEEVIESLKSDLLKDIKRVVRKHEIASLTKTPTLKIGQLKVAKYYPGKPQPQTEGFRNILIHTSPAGIGGPLSPYVLRNEQGQLLESIYQFSKVYEIVYAQKTALSRFQPNTIIWEHPREVHLENNELTQEFWNWRKKGMDNLYAVRYPNGFKGRKKCLFAIWPGNNDGDDARLSYLEARKKIYCGEYARLAPPTESFKKLKALLANGENIQIIEVDGPDPALNYPPYDQISVNNPGMTMNEKNIKILVNDERKPFGHGFCISALLLGGEKWIT